MNPAQKQNPPSQDAIPAGDDQVLRGHRPPRRNRPTIDTERAQEASRRLIAGVCRDMGWLWNRQEALHAQAMTRQDAAAAARPLLEVCTTCPIVNECRLWAVEDFYTGIAASAAWHEGRERPPSWIPSHPPRLEQAS